MEAVANYPFPTPLIWTGAHKVKDLVLEGHHLWDRAGHWVGCYKTATRASAELRSLPSVHFGRG